MATIFERRNIKISDIRGRMCAWAGCEAHCDLDLPPGWALLLLYRSRRPVLNFLKIPPKDCLRDAALCPEHTFLLERQFKEIGRQLADCEPEGTA